MKKKIIGLLAIFITCFGVFLTNVEAKGKVTIYLFSQATCPHCREAKAFFKELKKDSKYKDMFELRNITVDDKNHKEYQDLFEKAAEKMGDEADGVPYYVIGNTSFTKGYSSKYDDAIKEAIEEAYNLDNFVSPIADIVGENGEILYEDVKSDFLTPIIVLVIALAIIGGTIYFAKKSGEDETKEEKKKVKTEPVVKEEKKELPKEEEEEKESEPKEIETVKVEKKSTQAKKTTPKSTSSKTTKKTSTAKKSTTSKKTTTTKKAPTKKTTTTKTTTKKRNTTKK